MISSAIKLCRLLVSWPSFIYRGVNTFAYSMSTRGSTRAREPAKTAKKITLRGKWGELTFHSNLCKHIWCTKMNWLIITLIVPWLLAATTTLDPCLKQNSRWQVILQKVLQNGKRNCKILTWVNSFFFLHVFPEKYFTTFCDVYPLTNFILLYTVVYTYTSPTNCTHKFIRVVFFLVLLLPNRKNKRKREPVDQRTDIDQPLKLLRHWIQKMHNSALLRLQLPVEQT